jgi:hypothetical protein
MNKTLSRVGGKGQRLGGETKMVTLIFPESLNKQIRAFRKQVREQTGVRVSRSFILREGARLFMVKVNKDLAKAEKGALHAKKRKEYEIL